jgi:hypothetical protein
LKYTKQIPKLQATEAKRQQIKTSTIQDGETVSRASGRVEDECWGMKGRRSEFVVEDFSAARAVGVMAVEVQAVRGICSGRRSDGSKSAVGLMAGTGPGLKLAVFMFLGIG